MGSIYLQVIISSIAMAMTYVLMASGLVLQFSVMRLVNFAYGQFYMLGAFTVYIFVAVLGCNFILGLLATIVVVGMMGVVFDRSLLRLVEKSPTVTKLALTIGVMMTLEGIVSYFAGGNERSVGLIYQGAIELGSFRLSIARVIMVVAALAIMAMLYFFVYRTKQGLFIRAVAQDRHAAKLFGISPTNATIMVMGIGSALAGAAGAIMAPMYYVGPYIGTNALIKGLIVITIGGMGSLGGAVIGGLILGLIDGFGSFYFGAWADVIGFVVIIAILLFKPEGLFGVEYEIVD